MLRFRKFPVTKKFMDKREEEVSIFSFESFSSHRAEKIRRGTLQGVTDSGIGKFYASEGYVTIFRRKFFVSQYRNIS